MDAPVAVAGSADEQKSSESDSDEQQTAESQSSGESEEPTEKR